MGRRLAIIIGNSIFRDSSLSRLLTPDADVGSLAEVLLDPEIGAFDDVKLVVNMSTATIRRSISHFYANKTRDDLLLLYFSGHGVLDEYGRLYLAVKDTERSFLSGTAIPAGFITDEMDHSRSRRQVLVLDCCHSGAFARGSKGSTGASVGTASVFEGKGFGRVVLTASDATQYAWEGDQVIGEAENSVFTHYLIQGLQTGQADADGDGIITVDELYDYVYQQIVTQTPKQTPGKWTYKEQGEIVIARTPISLPPKDEQIEVPEIEDETEAKLKRLYESGLAAYWLEDWEKAIWAFQAIVDVRPDYPGAAERLHEARRQGELTTLHDRAQEALNSQDWEAAVAALESLAAQDPENEEALSQLKTAKEQKALAELYTQARLLYQAEKWYAAEKVMQKLRELAPDFSDQENLQTELQEKIREHERRKTIEGLYSQALSHIDQGQWLEARQRLEEVQALEPGYRQSERLLSKAESELENLEEQRRRQEEAMMRYQKASEAAETGQWRKALAIMEEIREISPGFEDPDELYAQAHREVEREVDAARRKRELEDLYAEAIRLLEGGDYRKAQETWQQVRAQAPDFEDEENLQAGIEQQILEHERQKELERLYNQTQGHIERGQWQEARQSLQEIQALDPGYRESQRLLAEAEGELERLEEERRRQEKVTLRYQQAKAAVETGYWRTVLSLMEEIRDISPDFVDPDDLYAQARQEIQRQTEEEAKRKAALEALYAEALQLLEAGDYDKALDTWDRIQAQAPDYIDTQSVVQKAHRLIKQQDLYDRAMQEIADQHWKGALEALEQLRAIDPDYRDVEALISRVEGEIQAESPAPAPIWEATPPVGGAVGGEAAREAPLHVGLVRKTLAWLRSLTGNRRALTGLTLLLVVGCVLILVGSTLAINASISNNRMRATQAAYASAARRTDEARAQTSTAQVFMEETEAPQAPMEKNLTVTADAQRVATRKSQTALASTAEARKAKTATAREASAEKTSAVRLTATAEANPLVFGPGSGSLDHEEDGLIERRLSGVDLRDFIAQASFEVPYPVSTGSWDIGFLFRNDPNENNQQFRLAIESDQSWSFWNRDGDQDDGIASGSLDNLNINVGGSNQLKLIAMDTMGLFFLNGRFIAPLDLSSRVNAGDVSVATEILSGDDLDSDPSDYRDFSVWKLVPAVEPTDGVLISEVDNRVEQDSFNLDLRDFIADATFHNPQPYPEDIWDIGYFFRWYSSGNFRLIVESDSNWWLGEYNGEFETIDSGPVTNFDASAEGLNRLTLIAQDDQSYLFLNGVFVSSFDVSSRLGSGDVAIGTGFFTRNEMDNRETEYEAFSVWELP